MKQPGMLRWGCVLLLLATAVPAQYVFIRQVKNLAYQDVKAAQDLVETQRGQLQEVTPQWLTALSWLARGASAAEDWQVAEKYAQEVLEDGIELLQGKPLEGKSSESLPTALGAAVEVLSQAQDAAGDRPGAVAFLRDMRARFAGSSIEPRIQKNLLLLSLEGKPFPELDTQEFIGRTPPTAQELEGKVRLFYFWAHWCSDCKRQKPILERLHARYANDGLAIVGPTKLYGYAQGGEDATPEQELDYLKNAYQERHPIPSWMPVPVSERNFVNFGVSSTPTLVLVDRGGIVRLYHPGEMSHEELTAHLIPLLQGETD